MSSASSSSQSSATVTQDGATVSAAAAANCTAYVTNSTQKLSSYLHVDYNRVVYTITLAISSVFLMIILICFGPYRRRSRNKFVVGALWAAHALPYTVMAHTLGLMQSPPYQNKTYAIWAMLCLLIHGISNSTIYGSQDKQQEKKQVSQEIILLYLAGGSLYVHRTRESLDYPLLTILGVAALKFIFRMVQTSFAYSPSCRFFGLRRRTKLVADFMDFEHELSRPHDPVCLRGYNYLVKGDEKIVEDMANKTYCQLELNEINKKVITVEKIWKCRGTLLGDSEGQKLKDKCLSFALFRLLAVRFRGFPLKEEHHSKTWDLVHHQLLPTPERTFRVIEDELSFLYDYFYTQYPLLFSDGKFFVARTTIYVFLELAHFLAALWIIFALASSGQFSFAYSFLDYYKDYKLCQADFLVFSGVVDYDCAHLPAGIHFFSTCIFVVVYVVLQLLQLLTIVFSNWATVWFVCEYVERSSWPGIEILGGLLRFVRRWKPSRLKPWTRKMEQYDLLSSYRYRPTEYFVISPFVDMPKRGQQSQDGKKLDTVVKSAVLKSLMENGRELKNGLSSLKRNEIAGVSWACSLKTTTDSILVWHVATSLCAMELEFGNVYESPDIKEKRQAAECLSRYCAYLVAFLPELLPDPTDATELIFDKAVLGARNLLKKGNRRCMYDQLKALGTEANSPDELGVEGNWEVVQMGAKLGMQLLSAEEKKRWKVLEEFWAEMLLYLAPSNNLTAHAESLANGGEFITHLWALLTHVGGCRNGSEHRQDDEHFNPVAGNGLEVETSVPGRPKHGDQIPC